MSSDEPSNPAPEDSISNSNSEQIAHGHEITDARENTMGALTRWSLERRVGVLVILLTILVVGFVALRGIPLELFPRGFEGSAIQVFAPWPESVTEEALQKVTLPLEEELSTVRGLETLTTFTGPGSSSAFLLFKQGADMDVAYREVRDRVQRAKTRLPDDIDQVFISKEDASGIPVMVIGLAIDPTLADHYNLIQDEVVMPLSRIEGVATVNVDGMEEKEIIIEVDRELAQASGVNIYEVAQDLSGDNFTIASGHAFDADKKFLVRSVATYRSLEEFENRIIQPNIRLKDIARVRYEEPEKKYSVRVNSRPAVAVVALKEGEANTVDVSRRLNAALEKMKENPRLKSIYIEKLFNQGDVVEESIGSLVDGGKVGGALAAFVLLIFMRRFRLTGIITASIPLSLLIALTVMYFMGETLNILSILGLVICVGLLVDNSVVIAENIQRKFEEGMSAREACVHGAGEIALAITMATLTTVIVFLPVSLVEGRGQFFLLRMAVPISVSLLASLFVALVFIPLSVYLTLPRGSQTKKTTLWSRFHDRINGVMEWFYHAVLDRMNQAYGASLKFFLRRRMDLVLLLIGLFALTQAIAFKEVSFTDVQNDDQTNFMLRFRASTEYSFEDLKEYMAEVEDLMEKNQERYGIKGYLVLCFTQAAQVQGWFDKDDPDRPMAKKVAETVLKELPKRAGIEVFYGRENQMKEEKNVDLHNIQLVGEDAEKLKEVAESLKPIIDRIPGVLGIRGSTDAAPNQIGIFIDRDRAVANNVNPEVIAGVVGYALRGQQLPRYNDNGKQIPVRVRFEEADREDIAALQTFEAPSQSGDILTIGSLTRVEMLSTARQILRRDKKVSENITVELKKEKAGETKALIEAWARNLDLPEGVMIAPNQADMSQFEDLKTMGMATLLSALFIYLLMGFLFESFALPLSIILTIPLASVGVFWIHYFWGMDLDFLGLVGSVLLVGVVVNNGIVLIDYVNRLRLEGHDRFESLTLAAERRFRPILMTALTTIIGMIPLALSEPSDFGLSYKSFGLTLIGGMTSATLLTLLVIPVFYTLFDDARVVVGNAVTSGARRRSGKTTPKESVELVSSL